MQTDSNVDQRVLQRRYDALKTEHRDLTKRLEGVREMVSSEFGPILKAIAVESAKIADSDSANRIKTSIKQLIELRSKL